MCIPSDRTFPIISKISSSRELHELAEIMGPVSVGEQRPVLLCWTRSLRVSHGHSQVPRCCTVFRLSVTWLLGHTQLTAC